MRRIFAFLLACAALYSDAILDKPQGRVRDFASLLYLRQNNDKIAQNSKVFYTLKSPKFIHLTAYSKRTSNASLSLLVRCREAPLKTLVNMSAECIAISLTPSQSFALKKELKLKIADKIEAIDPNKAKLLRSLATNHPLKSLLKDKDLFFALTNVPNFWHTPRSLTKKDIETLQDDPRYSELIERLAVANMPHASIRWVHESDAAKLDYKGAFYLGIIYAASNDKELAFAAFQEAEKKAATRYARDRALFWQWKVKQDKQAFTALLTSQEINFYSLLAYEIAEKELPSISTQAPAPEGSKAVYSSKDFGDPYFWDEIRKMIISRDIEKLKQELDKMAHSDGEAYRARILYLLDQRNLTNYYLNPYKKLLEGSSKNDQALILAIMCQESRFIAPALSASYAVGVMQMMPFLIEDMKKSRKDKAPIWSFFDPAKEIPYAMGHIAWLQKKVSHPLYLFYSYNAGYGYTRRVAADMFSDSDYEPYLGLERIS
ncbi:MAG: lytic transglycosylase domain-containing protein, partial [Helicobacteraceae bacterium]|nr:lytic transglycosylase domain-containing protein [Helicobacteraceae bacterium]